MLVSELIERLQHAQKENGDIEVRLNCDHNQVLMEATWVDISHIEANNYAAEPISDEDLQDYDNPIKVIEIQAY